MASTQNRSTPTVVIAVDPHKRSWTAAAVDARMQPLAAPQRCVEPAAAPKATPHCDDGVRRKGACIRAIKHDADTTAQSPPAGLRPRRAVAGVAPRASHGFAVRSVLLHAAWAATDAVRRSPLIKPYRRSVEWTAMSCLKRLGGSQT